MKLRGSGILLHISSLPSRYGIGDFGPAAFSFVDFLAGSGQKYWQILPLNPTHPTCDNNPYHSVSAFALNPLFISPDVMANDGFIGLADIGTTPQFPENYVDFKRVIPCKEQIFSKAYDQFAKRDDRRDYEKFCRDHAWWLEDFALFSAIRGDLPDISWNQWPDDLKLRKSVALKKARERLHDRIERTQFLQFIAMLQWKNLKKYCRDRGICIIGDLPIYVDYDSADVWQHPDYFKLDLDLEPTVIAGVPPDYFSATGQLWDNPVYNWETLKKSGFSWWVQRIDRNLALADYVRIDHFRGLVACWEVPAGSATAMNGKWVEAPAKELLTTLTQKFPCLPVIAEDLGVITPDIREMMQQFGLPGMKVLLFAFEEGFEKGPYIPHNLVRNCILYTGTHDNNTVRGWIDNDATKEHREKLRWYFGYDIPADKLNRAFIRLALASVANTVILPVQDLLGLGSESRMNRPGIHEGNWKWRVSRHMLTQEIRDELHFLTTIYGRD